jgi:general secretion pathway protein J
MDASGGRAIPSRGFTLIELLVAVAIFGVLSGMAYRALTVVLDSRDRIELETRKWRELALFFTRLEQDVTAIAPRPIRDGQGARSPAVSQRRCRGAIRYRSSVKRF